jgi:hypothetical protein
MTDEVVENESEHELQPVLVECSWVGEYFVERRKG